MSRNSKLIRHWKNSQLEPKPQSEPSFAKELNEPLTDEQIENWRQVLLLQLGPYALLMSKEEIEVLRDRYRNHLLERAKGGKA